MNGAGLPLWALIPATLLLLAAGVLVLTAALGLLRMPDFYSRLHPPTMGTTLGCGCVLVASMLVSSALQHRPVIHEVLIGVFLVLSAPVTAMLLMRAALTRQKNREPEG